MRKESGAVGSERGGHGGMDRMREVDRLLSRLPAEERASLAQLGVAVTFCAANKELLGVNIARFRSTNKSAARFVHAYILLRNYSISNFTNYTLALPDISEKLTYGINYTV